MQQSKTIATMVGLFVTAGLIALFFLAMQVSNLSSFQSSGSYIIKARFENVGGLKVRSPVTVAGVRIGRVKVITFDKEAYEAIVDMSIESHYDTLPTDTSASIFTSGLLGEQYIGLEPGGDEEFLGEGDFLELTQSALVLEEMIGRFLFKKAEGSGEN